jgi:hypothetical protein
VTGTAAGPPLDRLLAEDAVTADQWTLAEVIVASRRPDSPLDVVLVVAAAAGCAFLLRPRQRQIWLGDTST